MSGRTYPNVKQGILLILFFFLSFALYFTCFALIPQILGFVLSDKYTTFVYSFASPIATIPLLIFVSWKSGLPIKWSLSIPGVYIIFLLILLVFLMVIITNPLSNLKEHIKYFIDKKIAILYFVLPEFDLNLAIQFVGGVMIAPIIEEYFMRKQILGMLLTKYSPQLSIILSSILFAAGHLRLESIVYLFVWGLLLGIIYYKTNSIEIAILIHAFWNLAGLFFNEKYVDLVPLQLIKYFIVIVINLFVIYLIIYYLTRKYRSKMENSKPTPESTGIHN